MGVLTRLQEPDVAQLATIKRGIAPLLNHKDVRVNTAQVLAHVRAEDGKMLSAISVWDNDGKAHGGNFSKGVPGWGRRPNLAQRPGWPRRARGTRSRTGLW